MVRREGSGAESAASSSLNGWSMPDFLAQTSNSPVQFPRQFRILIEPASKSLGLAARRLATTDLKLLAISPQPRAPLVVRLHASISQQS